MVQLFEGNMGPRFEVVAEETTVVDAKNAILRGSSYLTAAVGRRTERVELHFRKLEAPTCRTSSFLALLVILLVAARLRGRANVRSLKLRHAKNL